MTSLAELEVEAERLAEKALAEGQLAAKSAAKAQRAHSQLQVVEAQIRIAQQRSRS